MSPWRTVVAHSTGRPSAGTCLKERGCRGRRAALRLQLPMIRYDIALERSRAECALFARTRSHDIIGFSSDAASVQKRQAHRPRLNVAHTPYRWRACAPRAAPQPGGGESSSAVALLLEEVRKANDRADEAHARADAAMQGERKAIAFLTARADAAVLSEREAVASAASAAALAEQAAESERIALERERAATAELETQRAAAAAAEAAQTEAVERQRKAEAAEVAAVERAHKASAGQAAAVLRQRKAAAEARDLEAATIAEWSKSVALTEKGTEVAMEKINSAVTAAVEAERSAAAAVATAQSRLCTVEQLNMAQLRQQGSVTPRAAMERIHKQLSASDTDGAPAWAAWLSMSPEGLRRIKGALGDPQVCPFCLCFCRTLLLCMTLTRLCYVAVQLQGRSESNKRMQLSEEEAAAAIDDVSRRLLQGDVVGDALAAAKQNQQPERLWLAGNQLTDAQAAVAFCVLQESGYPVQYLKYRVDST